ncbi:MAG: hypothetical protein BWY95_02661 [Bacteroidetes bacterium ADurb.BinA104]|nr:MAG: hypothetical protein BWY95_02661 [Bacteroidetes bacterium ADurb.BinA104]
MLNHPLSWLLILKGIAEGMQAYQEACKRRQDWKLREALGDAVHLLGMNRKPPKETVTQLSVRIKDAVYPQGIDTPNLHEGERRFWRKYFEEGI